MMKLKNSLFAIILILVSCNENKKSSRVEALPFYKDASFTPYWIKTGSEEEKTFHKISTFKLTNQLGEVVSNETFKEKIYVTDFFFTSCPGICPAMTKNLKEIQSEFIDNEQVLLLSHSVTPKLDSVSVLNTYAVNKGVVANKWHLVTGSRDEIYDLGRNEYFIENDLGEKKSKDDFLHTENFLLIDKNQHIRGIYNGLNRASIAQLKIDIRALLKE